MDLRSVAASLRVERRRLDRTILSLEALQRRCTRPQRRRSHGNRVVVRSVAPAEHTACGGRILQFPRLAG